MARGGGSRGVSWRSWGLRALKSRVEEEQQQQQGEEEEEEEEEDKSAEKTASEVAAARRRRCEMPRCAAVRRGPPCKLLVGRLLSCRLRKPRWMVI